MCVCVCVFVLCVFASYFPNRCWPPNSTSSWKITSFLIIFCQPPISNIPVQLLSLLCRLTCGTIINGNVDWEETKWMKIPFLSYRVDKRSLTDLETIWVVTTPSSALEFCSFPWHTAATYILFMINKLKHLGLTILNGTLRFQQLTSNSNLN